MKAKKLFNSIFLSFLLSAMAIFGIVLSNANSFLPSTDAAFTEYTEITNNLPQYLGFTGGVARTQDNSIVLLDGSQNSFNLQIGDDPITMGNNTNYGYKPNDNNPDEYYLFNFTSALSLYQNITNQELENLDGATNLLQDSQISDFASSYANDSTVDGVDGLGQAPQQFNIHFQLGDSFSSAQNEITVEEGLYTLVIPMTVYHTTDGGLTYNTITENAQIEYTFMIFNSTTYFNTSGLQNATMENTTDVALTNNSGFSMFYYYNYTSTSLPKFSYDPYVYQITVNFVDYNETNHYLKVEYDGSNFNILDENGDPVSQTYIMTGMQDGQAYITFNELGSYDISFEYLYRVVENGQSEIFELPFDQLITDNLQLQYNKAQRLYVYGYQAMYTNFNEPVNPSTNQPYSRELKTISEDGLTFSQAADITARFSEFIKDNNPSLSQPSSNVINIEADTQTTNTTYSDLKNAVQGYLRSENSPTPVTTNQVPVSFISNATSPAAVNAQSKIYSVSGSDNTLSLTDKDDFTNENQRTPGTYVYILEYNFDEYLGQGGVQQSGYFHYQIFYFEITNETPAVTVLDETGNSFSTTRYTNKSVYLVNESTDSPYNADVTINVSMRDYSSGTTITRTLQGLASLDSTTFTYYQSWSYAEYGNNNSALEKMDGKEVVLISNNGNSANRAFTLSYFSTMTNPNTYSFTIDTNEIDFLSPIIANEISNGRYSLQGEIASLDNGIFATTNTPFSFRWNEKASGAQTYGYVKFFPLEQIDYYAAAQTNPSLIYNILAEGVLPVTYKINFGNGSSWSPISNTYGQSIVDGTSVKTDAGLYLLEVYDTAGNVGFAMFMLDNTSPTFIKTTITDTGTSYQVVNGSDIISVTEGAQVSLSWGDYKAIILQNSQTITENGITPDNRHALIDPDSEQDAQDKLDLLLTNFVSAERSFIRQLSPATGNIEDDQSLPYTNNYLAIEIEDSFAIKTPSEDQFTLQTGNSYQLDLFTSDGTANENTYQILLRDQSNNKTSGGTLNTLLTYPSGMLSVTITSDSSAVMIERADSSGNYQIMSQAGYSLTGQFYQNASGETQYYQDETFNTATGKYYRFAYYTPSTANNPIRISYVPLSLQDDQIAQLTLQYYPYTIVTDSGYIAYYDVADSPSRTITIYSSTDSASVIAGKTRDFYLTFDSTGLAQPGRYVITRTYQEGTMSSRYDYHQRTITIDIDPYNMIEDVQNVSNSDGSWYESVIGGEIVLSMYSGANQTGLQVSFPFDKNGVPTSDSFFNDQEWTAGAENQEVQTISVSGNKLPMMLYIPSYKYTTSAVYNSEDNSFSTQENNNLSYYGNARVEPNDPDNPTTYIIYVENIPVTEFANKNDALQYLENMSITQYQTLAVIEYRQTPTSSPVYYMTNGTEIGSNSGYLQFYQANSPSYAGGLPTLSANPQPINALYQAGQYTVTLYQASNEVAGSDFRKFYKFKFEITSQQPEVDVVNALSGQVLTAVENTTYYSNSDSLRFEWAVPSSEYIAKIDETEISIIYSNDNGDMQSIETGEITGSTTRSFTVNLMRDQIRANGAKLEVTMQYEGDQRYYNQVVIEIYFDTAAPTATLNNLIQNLAYSTGSQLSSSFLWTSTRSNFDYNENSEATLANIAYSYTPVSGNLRGFAYTVNSQLFSTLQTLVENAAFDRNGTQRAYLRHIGDSDNYLTNFISTSATTKDTFNANNFTAIDAYTNPSEIAFGVYEIVEIDSAGNMVTYLVNYVDDLSSDQDDLSQDVALTYQNNNLDENGLNREYQVLNAGVTNGANIYSNTGMRLTSLNYQNNPWAIYRITLADGTIGWYMSTPTLQSGYVYNISRPTPSEVVLTSFALSQIIPQSITSSQQKHTITFADSINGQQINTYLTIMDANLTTNVVNEGQNTAILDIVVPTAAQIASTSTGHIYPTNVVIDLFQNNAWQEILQANQTEQNYGTWNLQGQGSIDNTVSFVTTGTTLRITVNVSSNTKVRYVITDNFGNQTTVIQIANEAQFDEITGNDYVYTISESGNQTTYLANESLTYSYNTSLYSSTIEEWNSFANDWVESNNFTSSTTNAIRSLTFTGVNTNYDLIFRINLFDVEDADQENSLRTIYIKLYDVLPEYSSVSNPSALEHNYLQLLDKNAQPLEADDVISRNQTINFNGQILTADATTFTTYSENVTLRFSNGQIYQNDDEAFSYDSTLSYSVYISVDKGLTWENLNSSYAGYLINGAGEYQILIKYDSDRFFTNMCKLYYLTILDASTIYYQIRITTDAGIEDVERSEILYTNQNGKTFASTYIVALNYADKDAYLHIAWNEDEDLNMEYGIIDDYPRNGVYVEEYYYNCATSSGEFAIIYIPPRTDFVNTLNYEDATGSSTQITGNSATIYASTSETSFEQLKINFQAYYGIEENRIQVHVYKYLNGSYIEIGTTIYHSSNAPSYFYLDRAGSYRIMFTDSCTPANVHSFGNNDYLTITFINEVPFVISYERETGEVDENGNPITERYTGEKVQKAVYNHPITISLYNVSNYFQSVGFPRITVLRNGREITMTNPTATSYTFSDPGYYTITFSALSLQGSVEIRQSQYSFTILNANESRYSYSFANYKNYYVKSVAKNGIDITQSLIEISNFDTVMIGNQTYLSELALSYGDEKTGGGRYTITICSNQSHLASILEEDFTFDVWINSATPPLSISIAEGASTSDNITVSLNVQNFYNAIGDSYILVGPNRYEINSSTIAGYGETASFQITTSGTWYIQVYSASGNLLYSYKVYKTEPLNAFSIIAIVIGVIVLVVIIIITIKLRKRQRVK